MKKFIENFHQTKKYLVLIILFFTFFINIQKTSAATLFFETEEQNLPVEQTFIVKLMLDAQGDEINAIEGEITFDNSFLELNSFSDGDSLVVLWIEEPSYQCQDRCKITFSGIIPGGFKGVLSPFYQGYQPGKILDLIFKTKEAGQISIKIETAKALLNDSLGTEAFLNIIPLNINAQVTQEVTDFIIEKDVEPPEPFTPIISQDPNIFNGRYFLVFSTQDKGSGLDHYEIKEGRESFINAKSPYLLKYQGLDKEIIIKAVDKFGNERIVTLPPQGPPPDFKKYWKFGIIILLLLLLIIILIWIIIRRIKCQIKTKSS